MGLEIGNAMYSYNTADSFFVSKSNENRNINKDTKIVVLDKKTGKKYVMTFEQYLKFLALQGQKNNPQNTGKEPYELGPRKNGTRVIGDENVTEPLAKGSTAPNQDSATPAEIKEYEYNIRENNGLVDDFRQGKRGDCYLLAAIESIRNTEDGQAILAKNVKVNQDGSYTVTLPGAVAARKNYIKQGYDEDKCAITGCYTITKSAIEKAKSLSGKSYAYGDVEVIALELAMEAFRAEILETNNALGIKSERFIAGQIEPSSEVDTLSSGFTYDAIFVLTGQKSDLYEANKEKRKNLKYYIPGEYGYVGESTKLKKGYLGASKKGLVEVENYYNKESDLQRMLDKYVGKENEYSITVSFIVAKKWSRWNNKSWRWTCPCCNKNYR